MEKFSADKIRTSVRQNYKNKALSTEELKNTVSKCCGSSNSKTYDDISESLGYSPKDCANVPDGANLGLGCGNPQAIAALKPGQTVLDLGSGGGFDCFLASKSVGEQGKVIGVDMTPEMISLARKNAKKGSYKNTEFRLGEIEHLPVADNTIDVIISNCVLNLSPEKQQVFNEAFRVLKAGGRLAISDVVLLKSLPEELKNDLSLLSGCVSGASSSDDLNIFLKISGFEDIKIVPTSESSEFIKNWAPGKHIERYIVSASIEAVKK